MATSSSSSSLIIDSSGNSKQTSSLQKCKVLIGSMVFTIIVYLAFSSLSNRICEIMIAQPGVSSPRHLLIVKKTRSLEQIPNVKIIYRDAEWVRKSGCGKAPFKGRRILINYADNCCHRSQLKNCKTGLEIGGFDVCLMFNWTSIDDDFKKRNEKILSVRTGAGLWAWKPYIVYKTLLAMEEGDVLFYADAGSHFVANFDDGPTCLLAKQDGDIGVFTGQNEERKYTKADALLLMGCTDDKCQNGTQLTASFVLLRKTWRSLQFVSQWLSYANDFRIISNDRSRIANKELSEFVSHRNDQSIISILAKKWNIDQWPDPSQFGEFPFGMALRNKPECSAELNKTFIAHTRDKS